MQVIVGFGGRAGTGKTTAATMLHEIAQSSTETHFEFSEPIIETAQAWLHDITNRSTRPSPTDWLEAACDLIASNGVTDDTYNDEPVLDALASYLEEVSTGKIPTRIDLENKHMHRTLLEWIGTTALHVAGPNYWGHLLTAKITNAANAGAELITIGGVRSVADHNIVKLSGGFVVRLVRNNINLILPTESTINAWTPDYELLNDNGIDELQNGIRAIWEHIHLHTLD